MVGRCDKLQNGRKQNGRCNAKDLLRFSRRKLHGDKGSKGDQQILVRFSITDTIAMTRRTRIALSQICIPIVVLDLAVSLSWREARMVYFQSH